jgi:glycosyltransferase involved in cell wall biosynthesis
MPLATSDSINLITGGVPFDIELFNPTFAELKSSPVYTPDMKVSIITVTYNSARFLGDCIRSVQMQNYKNIEHIIIDGKSTDGTIGIIKKYEAGIAKWVSETDKGMYDAINKGMAMATGDVIGILNSDDVLDNDHVIFNIVKEFITHKTDAVYGDLEYVAQDDTDKVLRVWKGHAFDRKRFEHGWMPAHPTFYVKRKVVEKYGGYETHYFSAADYELMARYLYLHHISASYLPKLIVRMRVGGASNASLKQRLRANRRDYLAMRRNKIPFAFVVSILKPLIKLHQFRIPKA